MEDFLSTSIIGYGLLNVFPVEGVGKVQYTPRANKKRRTDTTGTATTNNNGSRSENGNGDNEKDDEDEGEEEKGFEGFEDYTDEESKALVTELYRKDTTGLSSMSLPPPLLQHNFRVRRGGSVHGNTTPIYLVATPSWSGRERILSMQKYIASYRSLINDTTLLKTPAPWQLSENIFLFEYTRRQAAKQMTTDMNEEQVAISVKGTQNPTIIFPVAAKTPHWLTVSRSYLELLLLFVDTHSTPSDEQPIKLASQQNFEERSRTTMNDGKGDTNKKRVRRTRSSAGMDLGNSQRRREIAALRPHFLYLLLRFIKKLDENVGYTFFNPFSVCHASTKKDSAWKIRNRLFSLSYMGDYFSREASIVAD